jgi:hypothetical protein
MSQLSLSCPSCSVLVSCHGCPVLVVISSSPVMSFLTVLLYLSCHGCPASVFLSPFSCPCCHVLTVLSICPFLAVLCWMTSCHVLAVMFWPTYPLCLSSLICPGWLFSQPFQADFSGPPVQADISQLSCPDYSALAVLCWLSSHSYPVLVFLSQLSCPCSHVLTIFSSLSYPGWHDLAEMILLTFPANLSRLTCPSYPVSAVMPWLSCPWLSDKGCPVSVVLSQLSCPIKPNEKSMTFLWLSCENLLLLQKFNKKFHIFAKSGKNIFVSTLLRHTLAITSKASRIAVLPSQLCLYLCEYHAWPLPQSAI